MCIRDREYSYLVTNTGNVTITDPVTVSDDRITNVVCPALPTGGLAPNTSISCTGTDVVTQSDLDAGSVTNVATASDGTVTSPESRITVDGTQNPGLEMVKTATVVNFEAPGDITSYEYVVTNTGNVTITAPIVVSDNLIASVSCPALPTGGLAPDASISCTADYVVTQSDLDAGSVTNLATATDGTITTPIASETIPADAAPGLSIAKTSPDTSFASLGQTLTYSYALTNEGNITLTGDVLSLIHI